MAALLLVGVLGAGLVAATVASGPVGTANGGGMMNGGMGGMMGGTTHQGMDPGSMPGGCHCCDGDADQTT